MAEIKMIDEGNMMYDIDLRQEKANESMRSFTPVRYEDLKGRSFMEYQKSISQPVKKRGFFAWLLGKPKMKAHDFVVPSPEDISYGEKFATPPIRPQDEGAGLNPEFVSNKRTRFLPDETHSDIIYID